MTSRNDDTLSLPGYSQELPFDVTVDEDFIPPSQPQSTDGSKISKNSNMSTKKLKCSDDISDSNIAETPPFKTVIDQSTLDWEESTDFIPETETKKTKVNCVIEDFSCKKKLTVFNSEDIFKIQSNSTWNTDVSRIPESPALETSNFSILNDTKALSNQEIVTKFEESVTEIIVNDSAETVDLEATPTKIKKSESERPEEKLKISCSVNSDVERCEETQVFDNSSVLLLGQPGTVSLDLEKNEISEVASEKFYLQQTIDDNEGDSQKEAKSFDLKFDPPPVVPELLKKSDTQKDAVDVPKPNENSVLRKEIQLNSLYAEQTNASTVTRKIDFKLTVSCFVTFNTKTNKVLQKIISNVNEIPKSKPKPAYIENASDNTSDKSKRCSTSSSGSVYSDKMGLPFALPKRVSAISDLTDSSEDEFGLVLKEERRALGRVPWSNEYLLPLKMDDIMQVSIEKEEFLKRPVISSPRKPKNRHCNGANHLKEILESSSSEQTSLCNLDTKEPVIAINSEEVLEKETLESSETLLTGKIEKPADNLEEKIQNEINTNNVVGGSEHCRSKKEEEITSESVIQKLITEHEAKLSDSAQEIKGVEKHTNLEGENTSIKFCDGLPVFARWTDKLYYSGILCGNGKNDRWDVKFDDGTLKAVREDFLMPIEWLKSGALVFVLVDDKYESGQIIDVKKGEEFDYVIELDILKKKVSVKVSDLCLTDVMAGIVREKYKPLAGSPRGKAEIDFENVLSGKRLREQRTPLKPFAVQVGISGTKKKSSSRTKKAEEVGLKSLKEIPSSTDPGLLGLKSENGHLLEDKVVSADSPSGSEMVETPLRGKPKEPRGKAKPRSLSYTFEETRLKKNWLAPDGSPIPGPSGIKFKKQKTNAKLKPEIPIMKSTESPTIVTRSSKKCHLRSKAPQPTEKSRRKRKLNDSIEDNIRKKSFKEGNSKINRKVKKG